MAQIEEEDRSEKQILVDNSIRNNQDDIIHDGSSSLNDSEAAGPPIVDNEQIPHRQYAPVQQIDLSNIKNKSVALQEIAKERARKKPQEVTCPHCDHTGMTKVQRKCTCTTVLKWIAMFLFFCLCIICICIYTPIQRGGAIQDYLECKWLHRSIVHYCGRCGKRVLVKHPKMAFQEGSSDEETGSSSGGSVDSNDLSDLSD